MRRLQLQFLFFVITLGAEGQSYFPPTDPFSQSSVQLVQTPDETLDRTANLNADFDALGNRLVPLRSTNFIVPVNYETNLSSAEFATNLGPASLISYSPILPITGNPYSMRPSIEVLARYKRLDVQRPTVGVALKHDTALPTRGLGNAVETISHRVSTELRIQTAPDRPGRLKLAFGYRPNIINYLEHTELNTLDHQAFLQMGMPIQKLMIGYAATFSQTTDPSLLAGAQSQSTSFGQTLQVSYDLRAKLKLDLQTGFNVSQQSQPLTEQLGASPIGETTAISTRANLVFSKNEKVSLSTSLGYNKSLQDSGALGGLALGGNRDTISTGVGLSYAASEKLQMTLGGGMDFIKMPAVEEIQLAEFYELSTIYSPTPDWEFAFTFGTSTTILATGFGIPTNSEYMRFGVRKNIFRRVNLSAAMDLSSETVDSGNALAAALGGRDSTTQLVSASIPLGSKTTLNLSYTMSSITSSTALLQQENNTSLLELRHQF